MYSNLLKIFRKLQLVLVPFSAWLKDSPRPAAEEILPQKLPVGSTAKGCIYEGEEIWAVPRRARRQRRWDLGHCPYPLVN
eukprot:s29_g78.t1